MGEPGRGRVTRRHGGRRHGADQQRINAEGMALVRRTQEVAGRLVAVGLSIRHFWPWNEETPYRGTRADLVAGLVEAEEVAGIAEEAASRPRGEAVEAAG